MKVLIVDDEWFLTKKFIEELDIMLKSPKGDTIKLFAPGKTVVLCGTSNIKAVLQERLKDEHIVVLTVDDARELGIDTTEAIIHSLPPMKIVKPFFEEKRKGHVRPYKFHR